MGIKIFSLIKVVNLYFQVFLVTDNEMRKNS